MHGRFERIKYLRQMSTVYVTLEVEHAKATVTWYISVPPKQIDVCD